MLTVAGIVAIGVEYDSAAQLRTLSRTHLIITTACQQNTDDDQPSPPEYLARAHTLHHPLLRATAERPEVGNGGRESMRIS